jgi:hypothetical protein
MRHVGGIAAALVSAACVTGCAGARTTVVAPAATVPVSMSRAVRDDQGQLVTADRRKVVGQFHESRTAWNILWSVVPLTPTTDISESVNEQVSAVKGDAVVYLTIVSNHCALNYLLIPFGILPFWPGCATIDVTGDIVQVSAASPPAPPAPPAPPSAPATTPVKETRTKGAKR